MGREWLLGRPVGFLVITPLYDYGSILKTQVSIQKVSGTVPCDVLKSVPEVWPTLLLTEYLHLLFLRYPHSHNSRH